ncbi:heterokaryon incompatibility protein-domain-containing protein [Triangularia verruculosa]|uniref:Heterokaryon incompatibility protein-domain-containing protein n=1 Tax=Triangularia verruculosa TaxID=2587418 RepID=A0AAN6XS61_9PEZI|nr:heterokaryon incompatibility protein-domain-containing protein [Triangularia verruculosa]
MPSKRQNKSRPKTHRQIKPPKEKSCLICKKIILAFKPRPPRTEAGKHNRKQFLLAPSPSAMGGRQYKGNDESEIPYEQDSESDYDSDSETEEELGTWKEVMVDSACQRHKEVLLSNSKEDRAGIPESTLARASVCVVHDLVDRNQPRKLRIRFNEKLNSGCREQIDFHPFHLLPNQPSDNLERYGRLMHAHWIDYSLFGQWKNECDRGHRDCIHPSMVPPSLTHIRPLWLVDVLERRIVLAQPSYRYACLSYVWGSRRQFTTRRSNLKQLQEQHSLSCTPVARTIIHAMAVAEMAGERYLWVDALCIVQDDEEQKHREVQNMSGIYANASFTIIARSATHANSDICGLFGVSQKREIHQNTWRLEPFATLVDIEYNSWRYEALSVGSTRKPQDESSSRGGPWVTRGWTFQEELFSRRQLVFRDNGPTLWKCLAAEWREDVRLHKPTDRTAASYRSRDFRSLFHDVVPKMRSLSYAVEEYSLRYFTLPEDSLGAFSGIATALLSSFHAGFVSGLPVDFFHIAVLWKPQSKDVIFRSGNPPVSANGSLPSWSWVAWQGRLDLECWMAAETYDRNCYIVEEISPIVSWRYHINAKDPGVVIGQRFCFLRERFFHSDIHECPPGWSRKLASRHLNVPPPHQPRDITRWYYSYDDGPESLQKLLHPIPLKSEHNEKVAAMVVAPWISCDTYSAQLCAAEEMPITRWDDSPCISLRDSAGNWSGVLILNPNPLMPSVEITSGFLVSLKGQLLTLVEVARACKHEFDVKRYTREADHPERPRGDPWYEYYYVMWIEWKDGVAYRKGLGTVVRSIWEAQDRKPVHLMLG